MPGVGVPLKGLLETVEQSGEDMFKAVETVICDESYHTTWIQGHPKLV